MPDGREVGLFTMTNHAGASVTMTNYGAIVTSIIVPDRTGVLADVALGFDTLDKYLASHGSMGDTIGSPYKPNPSEKLIFMLFRSGRKTLLARSLSTSCRESLPEPL